MSHLINYNWMDPWTSSVSGCTPQKNHRCNITNISMTLIRRGQLRGGVAEVRHLEHGRRTAAEINVPRGRSRGLCRCGRAAVRGSGGPLPRRTAASRADSCG